MAIEIVPNRTTWLRRSIRDQDKISTARPLHDVTIIVPTINAARYIDMMMQFYKRDLSVPVTLFVDSKTTDSTEKIGKPIAHRVVPVRNTQTRVGEIIETISRMCSTKWILRLDDDELPSTAMMEFVHAAVHTDAADAYSFRRHQCAVSHEGMLVHDADAAEHRQWRLYRRDRVRYRTEGHTPGFHLDGLRCVDAPPGAAMIHLDWALHSYDERKRKIMRYDAHTPNHGSMWRSYYLYEEQRGYQYRFRPLHFPEFDGTCREISRRFSELTLKIPHRKILSSAA